MILELHRQGVSVSAIARQVGLDRKTVHKYIERGLEPPMYGPRAPAPFEVRFEALRGRQGQVEFAHSAQRLPTSRNGAHWRATLI